MGFTTLSLFAGAGGCSLGFSRAGFDVEIGIDHDNYTTDTYAENLSDTKVINKDISSITPKFILDKLRLEKGELDFLIGGPPCQGFSSAGSNFWDDPRNQLLKHYVRILENIRPKWFLVENVEGLLTAQKSEYITNAAEGFIEAGYTIRIHKLYSHWHGLPQKRKRVFIVGNSGGIDFAFPKPSHNSPSGKGSPRSIMDAICDLPPPTDENKPLGYTGQAENEFQKSLRAKEVTDHYTSNKSSILQKRIEHLEAGQSMQDLPEELQHDSFSRRSKRRVMDGTPTEERGGAPSGLKRLSPDKPSLTITGGSISEFVHPVRDRFLTLRECARIQSFPDWFQFSGPKTSKIQQIGNAIPPMIAERLASHFASIMEENKGISYGGKRGRLLGFFLTKANSKSPALRRTAKKLSTLTSGSQVEIW